MRNRSVACCALVLAGVLGCADAPTGKPASEPPVHLQATKSGDALAPTRWNLRATDLHQTLPPPPTGQAWASRMLPYLSIAQYRAALVATASSNRRAHPSVSAAVD